MKSNNIRKCLSVLLVVSMAASGITVLAEEEHGTGLHAMTAERREQLLQRATVHTGDEVMLYSTDESVDNSDTIYFPEIKSQGSAGACVAYATTYYQMSYTVSKALNQDCEDYTFNPLWTYSLINSGVDEGSVEDDAYAILSDFGAPKYSEFTGAKTSPETKATVWESAMQYKIDPDDDDDNWDMHYFEDVGEFIVSAKQQLASGKVLTTGSNSGWWYGDDSGESVTVKVTNNGTTTSEEGIAYVYDNGEDEGRHLITIVGYDDNIKFTYGSYSTTGGFKIANSWGTSWGNDGYIWVAYDAFYSDSDNRSSSRNGHGFISSWWNEGTDENVYYTMDLDDNYSIYTPEYVGEVALSSKKLSEMILRAKGKTTSPSNITEEMYIYDGSYYSGMPSKSYSGTIALDLSNMSDYIDNESAYWEITLDGISTAYLKIVDSTSNTIYPKTSGTVWGKSHTHNYIEGEKVYSTDGTWSRIDTCSICDGTTVTTGVCSHNYIEGESVYSTDGTWSRTDTCSICGNTAIVEGECSHNYVEGERVYSSNGTWSRTDTCSICGHQVTATGDCEHSYVNAGVSYNGSTWSENEVCTICNHVNVVDNGTCYFNLDFENGVSSDWTNNGRGVMSAVTDGDNTYMKVEYVNADATAPNYYEVCTPANWAYSSLEITGQTEMSFDIMFEGTDGDIYLKRRAEDINDIVLRICSKEVGRLQYGTNGSRRSFFDANDDYVNSLNRWFHVRIVANISENTDEAIQTIYVTDKTTGELISTMENKNIATAVPYCNMICIGGSCTVNVDNIIVRDM